MFAILEDAVLCIAIDPETTIARPRDTTMLELVSALSAHARSEDEVVAWVVALVSSGAVRLCGIFKGTRFEASIGESAWQPVSTGASPQGGGR